MVFSSILFLLYFLPAFMLLYFFADPKYKNYLIVAGSIFFYMWGAPKFVLVIVASIILDYYLSHLIYSSHPDRKKRWLVISILINVSILLYFKYSNFFVENVNAMLSNLGSTSHIKWTNVALPIGISFFTFHELSYIIDVYRGVNKPMKKISDYAVYILLFPQLIAGPIIRYKEISHQILDRTHQDTIDNKLLGLIRFIIGLAKKVLIANVLAAQADLLFAVPSNELSTWQAWIGILAYTFQIYFDFSGYSDMAIGLALMMGFKFPENFDNPYIAQNITEFWRRWHMSLGRWMRDYLYIPLGGNKVDTAWRLYFNLWIVFIISGFWHGASWNFIAWGAYHGFFLICDRLFLIKLFSRIGKPLRIAINFIIVMFGWVLFRAKDLTHAIQYAKSMFGTGDASFDTFIDNKVYAMLVLSIIICTLAAFNKIIRLQNNILFEKLSTPKTISLTLTCIVLFILCLGSLATSAYNPFIYFRF